jgi:hypothetical protein
MTVDDALYLLLVLSLAVSCVLILAAMTMTGKKLADRGYQRAAGVNGTNRIQNVKELRTYALRVCVGVTFAGFAILLLADAPQIARQWFNRSLFVLLPLGYLAATVTDWFAEQEQLRIEIANAAAGRLTIREQAAAAEVSRLAVLKADRDAYREMAAEAVAHLRTVAEATRQARDDPLVADLAPVVPEHSSPITEEQRMTAERATLRADLTASTLSLGLPSRETAPAQTIVPESVDVVTIQPGALDSIVQAVREDRPSTLPSSER